MLQLVLPSEKYKRSFLEAAQEFRDDTTEHASGIASNMKKMIESGFDSYTKQCQDYAKGTNLPADYVPATEFWLIGGEEFIGQANIRHRLNDFLLKIGGHIGYAIRPSKRGMGYGTKILELALVEAKKLGIKKALVNCDKDNIGSAKIIERNGGILENESPQGDGKPPIKRYWMEIEE